MVGRTISHYRVLRLVGAGGAGVVYEAEDLTLGRHVALKFLPPGPAGKPLLRQRFEREARAASALNHPHICTVHDFLEQDGDSVIVMELLEGRSLREALKSGPLEFDRVVALAVQIADALDAAHAAGITHRDVSPSNIFVTDRGDAKVLDFGLAKLASDARAASDPDAPTRTSDPMLSVSGELMGTVAYMSPEQVRGDRLDHRTDLFSFGAVLYEMAAGVRAFPGRTTALVCDGILHAAPPPVARLNPTLPEEFDRILAKALEKERSLRYQGAGELKADLQRLQRDLHREGATLRTRRWGVRGWATTGAVLLVIAALGAASSWRRATAGSSPAASVSRQVTSGEGIESDPAVSPDGSTIAYTADQSGNQDVWIVDVQGPPPHQFTRHPANDRHPSWFPDGSTLAFASDRGGTTNIWRAPRFDGNAATLLVADGDMPAVSPNGQHVAFVRSTPGGYSRIAVAHVGTPDVRVISRDEDGQWDHSHPAWSPDGRTIGYTAWDGIWVVPASGGAGRRVTAGGSGDREATWSSDGKFLYFSSMRDGRLALWRVRVQGGEPERLTAGAGVELSPSIARDGALLAFATSEGSLDLDVSVLGEPARSALGSTRDENFPVFSPDGRTLYFLSAAWVAHDIWTQRLDERGLAADGAARLAAENGIESHLACSPDGKWLAYYRLLPGARDLFVIPTSGGATRSITSDGRSYDPAWAPDARRLAFISERSGSPQVWVQPVDNGAAAGPAVQVTRDKGVHQSPTWSPDGRQLAYLTTDAGAWMLNVTRADGSGEAKRVPLGGEALRARWHRSLDLILVAGRWGSWPLQLRAWRPDGTEHEPVPLALLGFVPASAMFDVSANGRLLVTPTRNKSGDIWVFEAASRHF